MIPFSKSEPVQLFHDTTSPIYGHTLLSSLCSPDGYLYEREAILEYILHQKKEIARQMKVSPFYV